MQPDCQDSGELMEYGAVLISQAIRYLVLACLLVLWVLPASANPATDVVPAVNLEQFRALVAGSSESSLQGVRCPWNDCRGCDQYRKVCGGVARDFTALNVNPTGGGGLVGEGSAGYESDTGAGTSNDEGQGGSEDENTNDPNDTSQDEVPGADSNHSLVDGEQNLKVIPTLNTPAAALLTLVLLLVGLSYFRTSGLAQVRNHRANNP